MEMLQRGKTLGYRVSIGHGVAVMSRQLQDADPRVVDIGQLQN